MITGLLYVATLGYTYLLAKAPNDLTTCGGIALWLAALIGLGMHHAKPRSV